MKTPTPTKTAEDILGMLAHDAQRLFGAADYQTHPDRQNLLDTCCD